MQVCDELSEAKQALCQASKKEVKESRPPPRRSFMLALLRSALTVVGTLAMQRLHHDWKGSADGREEDAKEFRVLIWRVAVSRA